MAYSITGSPADVDAVMAALQTFAAAQGWTTNENNTTTKVLALSSGTVYVAFQYNDPSGSTQSFKMAHALGYTGGNNFWNHPSDCGQTHQFNTTANYEQSFGLYRIGLGPYTSVRFFGNSSQITMALEITAGVFHYIMFGNITKYGDWTGGEFSACTFRASTDTNFLTSGVMPFDGRAAETTHPGIWKMSMMHIEGLPNQPAGGKWGKMARSDITGVLTQDRAANQIARLKGATKSAFNLHCWGLINSDVLPGKTPLIPMQLFYQDFADSDDYYPLGVIPDIYQCSIENFDAGDEITIGSDTFQFLPMMSKTDQATLSTVNSRRAGFAIKK